jgi:hypothetical protein
MSDPEYLQSIIRHIKRVEDNCNRLAMSLQSEDFSFALRLVQRGRVHDASKFDSFEFYHLRDSSERFKEALWCHHRINSHHPEYHDDGIHQMRELDIAEMVCDCLARGQEFGTDTRQWFTEVATKRYGFTMDDDRGKLITKYLDLLLTKPFKTPEK